MEAEERVWFVSGGWYASLITARVAAPQGQAKNTNSRRNKLAGPRFAHRCITVAGKPQVTSGKAAEEISLKQGRCFGAVHLGDNRQHPSRHAGLDFTNPMRVAPGHLPRALHIKNHGVVLLALRDGCHGTPSSVLRILHGEVPHQVKKVSD